MKKLRPVILREVLGQDVLFALCKICALIHHARDGLFPSCEVFFGILYAIQSVTDLASILEKGLSVSFCWGRGRFFLGFFRGWGSVGGCLRGRDFRLLSLPQGNVQGHHDCKAQHSAHGGYICVGF